MNVLIRLTHRLSASQIFRNKQWKLLFNTIQPGKRGGGADLTLSVGKSFVFRQGGTATSGLRVHQRTATGTQPRAHTATGTHPRAHTHGHTPTPPRPRSAAPSTRSSRTYGSPSRTWLLSFASGPRQINSYHTFSLWALLGFWNLIFPY